MGTCTFVDGSPPGNELPFPCEFPLRRRRAEVVPLPHERKGVRTPLAREVSWTRPRRISRRARLKAKRRSCKKGETGRCQPLLEQTALAIRGRVGVQGRRRGDTQDVP